MFLLIFQIPPFAPPSSRMMKYEVLGGIPAYVATLKHLQPHVLLDAFQEGLKRENGKERAAVVDCMSVFLDTLIQVGKVQQDAKKEEDSVQDDDKSTSIRERFSQEIPYLNVQQDLLARARHCCYGDSWASRMGGVSALEALAKRMPQPLLLCAAHYIAKALIAVLRSLPDNAGKEIEMVTNVLIEVVDRSLGAPENEKDEDDKKEQDDEEEVPVTRRGKRGKRGSQSARKKQKGSPPPELEKSSGEAASRIKISTGLEKDAARLQNDLLQAIMSSKNNSAVRTAASRCLEILATRSGTSIGSMLDQILSSQPTSKSLLERRILPLRSIPTQTNYAHSMAFLFLHCPDELSLTPSLGAFIADSCTIMEMEEAQISANISMRGQTPRTEVISKLQSACMEVLVSALKWPSFRETRNLDVINHSWDPPGEFNIPVEKLRERIARVFVRRLGSSDCHQVQLCEEGIKLCLEHNLLEKSVLQEALSPILYDLANYNTLTVNLLEHLHRLLVSTV